MSPPLLFSIVSTGAFLFWLLLAIFPGRRWVNTIVCGAVVPAAFAVVYSVIVAMNLAGSPGGFSSLADVALLFGNPWLLLAGWIHYLAFDLLIGAWEVRDARAKGVPHLLVLPCLLMTFLFGPAGWLLYLGLRSVAARPAQ